LHLISYDLVWAWEVSVLFSAGPFNLCFSVSSFAA
jgi:hypothetical protein